MTDSGNSEHPIAPDGNEEGLNKGTDSESSEDYKKEDKEDMERSLSQWTEV